MQILGIAKVSEVDTYFFAYRAHMQMKSATLRGFLFCLPMSFILVMMAVNIDEESDKLLTKQWLGISGG